jgi:flagellar motor switch protein FliM
MEQPLEQPRNESLDPSLDLDELRALRGKARGRTVTVRPPGDAAQVAKFDPRQSGKFSAVQGQGVESLHQSFVAKTAVALGAPLHAGCELALSSVEQVPCGEFLSRVPEPSYLAAFETSLEARALLQIDLPLVLPILDLLLGGSGKDAVESRDLTEIEEQIFEPVGRAVGRELDAAWRPLLKMDFAWNGRLPEGRAAGLFTPDDSLLVLVFEARVQDAAGKLRLAFSSVLSTALLRKLTPQEPAPKPRAPQDRGRLREQLLGGRFEAELLLPRSEVSLRQLHQLQPGDVLVLKVGPQEPVEVHVAGRRMFLAAPVRRGLLRGAQVQKVLSIVPREEGEEGK